MIESLSVLDTHTGGEITRIVLAAPLGLQAHSAAELLSRFREQFDWLRGALTHEPRGLECAVGAIVSAPTGDRADWQVAFFNNVGYLGMCGHGLIGVVEALRYSGLLSAGVYNFDTPVGSVSATLDDRHHVSFTGVRSTCYRRDIAVTIDDGLSFVGDVAYGGNWFYIAHDDAVATDSPSELIAKSIRIRDAIAAAGVKGFDGAEIDHVELYCSLKDSPERDGSTGADLGCRNFVLCPGGHYDRSPCGTGTSAKLACLAARGVLPPETDWIQESITGSRFVARYRNDGDGVRVTVKGRAHVTAETKQIFDETDPLRFGRTSE